MDLLQRIADRCFQVGIALLAILLPLEIIPNKYISILSLLTTLLLIPRPFYQFVTGKPGLRNELHSWTWILLALPLVATLTSAYSHQGNLHSSLLRTLAMLLLRTWLVARFATIADLTLFKTMSIGAGAVVTVFGFYQFFGDLAGLKSSVTFLRHIYSSSGTHQFPRVHSLAREPLLLANYLFIPMALLIVDVIISRKRQVWPTLLLATMLILVLTLDARSGLYALAAAVVALLYGLRHRQKLLYRTVLSGSVVILAAGVIMLASIGPGVFTKFIHHGTEFSDASFQNRVKTWREFPRIFKNNLPEGVGLGNSSRAILHLPWGQLPTDPPVFNNTYLTLAVETGLLGLISLLPLVTILGWQTGRRLLSGISHQDAAYCLILIAYAVQITSYEAFLNLRFWAVIGLTLAAFRLYQPTTERAAT